MQLHSHLAARLQKKSHSKSEVRLTSLWTLSVSVATQQESTNSARIRSLNTTRSRGKDRNSENGSLSALK